MVRKNLRLVFPDKTIKEIEKIEKDFYKHFADITIAVSYTHLTLPTTPYV